MVRFINHDYEHSVSVQGLVGLKHITSFAGNLSYLRIITTFLFDSLNQFKMVTKTATVYLMGWYIGEITHACPIVLMWYKISSER